MIRRIWWQTQPNSIIVNPSNSNVVLYNVHGKSVWYVLGWILGLVLGLVIGVVLTVVTIVNYPVVNHSFFAWIVSNK